MLIITNNKGLFIALLKQHKNLTEPNKKGSFRRKCGVIDHTVEVLIHGFKEAFNRVGICL